MRTFNQQISKLIIITLTNLLIITSVFGQAPESFTYQAIVRDNSGQPLPNTSVTFQFNILQTSVSGTIVYSEDQTATTNDFGLVNLQIGQGTVQSGSFSTIDWGNDAYFLNIQINQGSGFVDMGTQQFLSVPYALFAKSAGNGGTTYTAGNGISITGNIIKNTAPDQIVNITGSGATTVTGTYPNFTVSSTDNVNDADADATNELQTLSQTGTNVTLSNGGGTISVADNDNDASNEIQALSVTGNQLSISGSGGNTVTMQVAAAGNSGDVQLNDNGAIGADPDLHWDITNKKFTVGQSTDDGRMIIQQDPNASDSIPILEVKNKAGQTIFVVYPDSVHVFIDDDNTKGVLKGGFAVSGRSGTKASTNDYLLVRPDSTRISFNKSGAKGVLKGGFAVSGRSGTKSGVEDEYFNISPNDTASIISPSEARIMWYPQKNAFLAGQVLVNSADSVGTNSLSVGYETKAVGEYSQALGYKPMALGDNATAIGNNANAIGTNSYAFGNYANTDTNAIGSYAIGSGAKANGQYSFAVGSIGLDSAGNTTSPTIAEGDYAYAFGMGSVALNQGAFAFGTQDTASGDYSLAMGYRTKAGGYYSTGMGYKTTASGYVSTAMGYYTFASGNYSTAMGYHNTASGAFSTSMGEHTTASGLASTSMGDYTTASGNNSTAMGYQTTASGYHSTAMGYNTDASGFSSNAMGRSTTASGSSSIAMGYYSTASGSSSTAMGEHTTASEYNSTAMGYQTNASGGVSTAMGSYTTASGFISTAMGYYTTASGDYSTAMGEHTTASGDFSTAMGDETTAQAYASAVLGRYNIINGDTDSWVDTDPLFVIGNGSSSSNRSNAMTVLKNGNVGIGLTNPSELLDVYGDSPNIEISNTSETEGGIIFDDFDDPSIQYAKILYNSGGSNHLNFYNHSTTPGMILYTNKNVDVNGLFRATGANWPGSGAGVEIAYDGTGYIQSYDRDASSWKDLVLGANNVLPHADNVSYLGTSSQRWKAVYAVNGTIQTSDRRMKKNIKNINYGLNTIMQLHPVSFEWKSPELKGKNIGLIAQEVLKIVPEVVSIGDDENKTLGMKYTSLIPILIKGMQEQEAKINKLENENTALINQNTEFKNSLNSLKAEVEELKQILEVKASIK